jgi:hypothetical protein
MGTSDPGGNHVPVDQSYSPEARPHKRTCSPFWPRARMMVIRAPDPSPSGGSDRNEQWHVHASASAGF